MTGEEKLAVALEALREIENLGHAPGCKSMAPLHECGCYDSSEKDIAREALSRMGEL